LSIFQLTTEDAVSGKIVIMEDSDTDSYVAIGEIVASNYTPERRGGGNSPGGEKVRVMLKSVTKPETILPFEVLDVDGTVLCRTLGDAFMKRQGVFWLECDTVVTQPDGCTTCKWP
jgi:hypothetical protein